ncbi:hypothetical protein U1Q18_017311 [Sarracenia purpurea var. burkii]
MHAARKRKEKVDIAPIGTIVPSPMKMDNASVHVLEEVNVKNKYAARKGKEKVNFGPTTSTPLPSLVKFVWRSTRTSIHINSSFEFFSNSCLPSMADVLDQNLRRQVAKYKKSRRVGRS